MHASSPAAGGARSRAPFVHVAAIVGALLLTPALAPSASAGPLDGQPTVRNKQLILEGRNIIAPTFGFTFKDKYTSNYMGGLTWRYFFESWIGVGVNVLAGTGVHTDMTDQINTELSSLNEEGSRYDLSTTSLTALFDLDVEIVPFMGKFMLFDKWLWRADFHFSLGFGAALVRGDGLLKDEPPMSLMPTWGVGFRLLPIEWISIGVEIRDYIVQRNLAVERDGSIPGASFDNNWLCAFSVGFFLPPDLEKRP